MTWTVKVLYTLQDGLSSNAKTVENYAPLQSGRNCSKTAPYKVAIFRAIIIGLLSASVPLHPCLNNSRCTTGYHPRSEGGIVFSSVDSAPSLGVYYILSLTLSVWQKPHRKPVGFLSVQVSKCPSVTAKCKLLIDSSFLFLDGIEPFLAVISLCGTLQNCFLRFLI